MATETKALPFDDWLKLNEWASEPCDDCNGDGYGMGGGDCPTCEGNGNFAYSEYLATLTRECELLSINYRIKAEVWTCVQLNTTNYKQGRLQI